MKSIYFILLGIDNLVKTFLKKNKYFLFYLKNKKIKQTLKSVLTFTPFSKNHN
jgi:hypothetical protein